MCLVKRWRSLASAARPCHYTPVVIIKITIIKSIDYICSKLGMCSCLLFRVDALRPEKWTTTRESMNSTE